MNLKQLRELMESNPTKDHMAFMLLSIAESLEKIANPVVYTATARGKSPSQPKAVLSRPESPEMITEDVNRELILKSKIIDPTVLEMKIALAKNWMFENPSKVKDSGWILRTARVMTFISNFPDRKPNKDEQKTKQISI